MIFYVNKNFELYIVDLKIKFNLIYFKKFFFI
jgi:hypothetical protein